MEVLTVAAIVELFKVIGISGAIAVGSFFLIRDLGSKIIDAWKSKQSNDSQSSPCKEDVIEHIDYIDKEHSQSMLDLSSAIKDLNVQYALIVERLGDIKDGLKK